MCPEILGELCPFVIDVTDEMYYSWTITGYMTEGSLLSSADPYCVLVMSPKSWKSVSIFALPVPSSQRFVSLFVSFQCLR